MVPESAVCRGLPSTRAVVGSLLVTMSALGVFVASRPPADGPQLTVVVAAADIAAGTTFTASHLTVSGADLDDATASGTFVSPDDLVGSVALGPIGAGELIQAGAVAAVAPDARLEVTMPVQVAHAPPSLARGEHVAVLATVGSTDDARTSVVVDEGIVVHYRLDTTALGADTAILTLAVASPSQVLAVTGASHTADVTVVRTTGSEERFTLGASSTDAPGGASSTAAPGGASSTAAPASLPGGAGS